MNNSTTALVLLHYTHSSVDSCSFDGWYKDFFLLGLLLLRVVFLAFSDGLKSLNLLPVLALVVICRVPHSLLADQWVHFLLRVVVHVDPVVFLQTCKFIQVDILLLELLHSKLANQDSLLQDVSLPPGSEKLVLDCVRVPKSLVVAEGYPTDFDCVLALKDCLLEAEDDVTLLDKELLIKR